MALRCLLFATDGALVQPIRQVLTELGVESEHCPNPVDAVERVTTQQFQIVITDWQDQPEAAFLLKTARDLKAAARPLTLAIVGEAGRPHALQAGANSVLLKPLRVEQVKDTLSTACELLRSKLQAPGSKPATLSTTTLGGTAAAAAPAPAVITQTPEKLRTGDFLRSAAPTPSAQFDTEDDEQRNSSASPVPVDSVSELEPMAAAVEEIAEAKPERQEPLTGWAALQARLSKSAPAPAKEPGAIPEMAEFESVREFSAPAAAGKEKPIEPQTPSSHLEKQTSGEFDAFPDEREKAAGPDDFSTPAPKPTRNFTKPALAALALIGVVLAAIPQSRGKLALLSRAGARAAIRWVNPPPPAMQQAAAQHDSFGQPDDEFKLPASGNIPDSTTDSSQIQVVPVIDPTAKHDKSADGNVSATSTTAVQEPAPPTDSPSANTAVPSAIPDATPANGTANSQNQSPSVAASDMAVGAATGNAGAAQISVTPAVSGSTQSANAPSPSVAPVAQVQPAQASPATPPRTRVQAVSASQMAGIPSSLKSQVGSTTPLMSGTKPEDAGSSSIGPVKLPESSARELLLNAVDPEYPDAAKASGQGGSVVLQVLIGPDGTVQDAKFLQGSFLFARSAIDAVKQWRFKPYSTDGQAVPVQSVITLNFKPSA